jgi:cytochrome c-type biogenesis protein CcmE
VNKKRRDKMMFYATLGIVTVAIVIGAGVYWLTQNVTFKSIPHPYEYKTDENGNESVKDNSDA